MPARAGHDIGRKARRNARLDPDRNRKVDLVERIHFVISPEDRQSVAHDLRQRPDQHLANPAPARLVGSRDDRAPVGGPRCRARKTAQIMLLGRTVPKPCLDRRIGAPPPRIGPTRHPLIVFELEHVRRRARPRHGQIRPPHFGRSRIHRPRQIDQQMRHHRRTHRPRAREHRRRRAGQQNPRRIQQRLLRRRLRAANIADHYRRPAKRRSKSYTRRIVVQANFMGRRHPPPWLANLDPRHQPRRHRQPDQLGRNPRQISDGTAMRRGQQHRRRIIARQPLCPRARPLRPRPRRPAFGQLERQREDQLKSMRLRRPRQFRMPRPRRRIHARARIDQPIRAKRRIMAHPDVVIDRPAIAQPLRRRDDPLGRQVIAIVVSSADPQRQFGHHAIIDRHHAPRPVTANVRQPNPPRGDPHHARSRHIVGRHDAHEHAVYAAHKNPLAGQRIARVERIEIDRHGRVARRPHGVIP